MLKIQYRWKNWVFRKWVVCKKWGNKSITRAAGTAGNNWICRERRGAIRVLSTRDSQENCGTTTAGFFFNCWYTYLYLIRNYSSIIAISCLLCTVCSTKFMINTVGIKSRCGNIKQILLLETPMNITTKSIFVQRYVNSEKLQQYWVQLSWKL